MTAPYDNCARGTLAGASLGDERPFVLAYRTPRGGHYVYDANTNRILRVSKEQFGAVAARFSTESVQRDARSEEALSVLRSQGLLLGPAVHAYDVKKHRPCLEAKMRTSLSQLILEVTEQCNLRCEYCVFGAGYAGQRPHGKREMLLAYAQQALDYFYSHNARAALISVGFYGGEPLLAWELIQNVIQQLPRYTRGTETNVHMTTNGTCLTAEKYRLLADNEVALLVSLDGPRAIHDRCRRSPSGKGSYDIVTSNLRALKKYAPAYYRDNVSFSVVQTPGVNVDEIVRFFIKNVLTRGHAIQMSSLSPGCPDLIRRLQMTRPGDPRSPTDDDLLEEFLGGVLRAHRRGNRARALEYVFGKRFITFHRRPICGRCDVAAGLNGMCTPTWRKLFVAADGALFTCERVRRDWPLGHVATGVDFDRVFEYLERHLAFHKGRCEQCWAVRLCGACQSTIGGPTGIDPQRVEEFCDAERCRLASLIQRYTQILEQRRQAFDFVEDVAIA